MQAPIKVGIVGAGTSATTFHAPFITSNPALQLVKFLRTSTTPVKGFEAVPVVSDLGAFLQPDIDLAVITTPTHTHFNLAKGCLEAGKHVILEKPAAVTYDECMQLCHLGRSKNKLLAVYQNRRWDGDYITVQKLLSSGALGRVVEYQSCFDRFRNAVKPGWKEEDLPGSGMLYDLGAHLIDQALTLFGPPAALTATVINQRQLPGTSVPDAFTVMLHFEPPSPHAHLTAILRASMLAKIQGPRFLLHGTKGSFVKYELDAQEGQLRAGMSPTDPGFGLENPKFYGVLDSVALDEPNLSSAEAGGAPAAPPAAATVGAPPAAAAAKAAVPMSWVTSSVLSEIDKGSSSGATVHVVTERGCWMEFYDNIANILLGKIQQQGQQGRSSAAAPAPDGAPEDAAAAASDLNSLLAVQPEQAAQVIRLIEAAMQSSKEGRTIRLG